METEVKKAAMLLKSLIFHYHGLEPDEKVLLDRAAEKYNAIPELDWANGFISEDYLSAYERAKEYLLKIFGKMSTEERLEHLKEIWEENYEKGYVTEMETTALINLSKDWQIEKEFLKFINN